MSEWYHWKHGCTTILWTFRSWWWWRATGVIRVHYNENKIPGDYHCAGTIVVKNGKYEVMGFIKKDHEAGTAEDFRAFHRYLRSLGLKRARHVRAKDGNVNFIKSV